MFTKTERLILSNQYQILKALEPEEADYYDEKIKILMGGYAYFYSEISNLVDDDLDEAVSIEVIKILNLYRELYISYSKLSSDEKADIPENKIKFEGFDGNEEGGHYTFAQFMLKDMDRYQELQHTYGYNTHRNVLPEYRRMLSQREKFHNERNLSKDQIAMIIAHKF